MQQLAADEAGTRIACPPGGTSRAARTPWARRRPRSGGRRPPRQPRSPPLSWRPGPALGRCGNGGTISFGQGQETQRRWVALPASRGRHIARTAGRWPAASGGQSTGKHRLGAAPRTLCPTVWCAISAPRVHRSSVSSQSLAVEGRVTNMVACVQAGVGARQLAGCRAPAGGPPACSIRGIQQPSQTPGASPSQGSRRRSCRQSAEPSCRVCSA